MEGRLRMKKQHTTISVQRSKSVKGGWIGYVYYYDNGKRRKSSAGWYKLKSDANEAAHKKANSIIKSNVEYIDVSFADYYQRWIETYKLPTVQSPSAQYQYKLVGKWIRKYFHDQCLREISRREYQSFLNWYGKNHSYESVRKIRSYCHKCVSYAVDDDVITKDFTNHSQLIYNKNNTRNPEYLSANEISLFRDKLISGLNPHYTSRYMILTALYTGFREGEVQGLTWDNIDFERQTITINKQWKEKEKRLRKCKTKSSNRTIKVNPILLDFLKQLKANGTRMVFENCWGKIPTSTALIKEIRKILAECGLKKRHFSFHSLRHVNVAYLLAKLGTDKIDIISKRMGHSNIKITLSVYAYLIDEFKDKGEEEAVDVLAEI